MYGEVGIITLGRIKREDVDAVCSTISITYDTKIIEQNKSIITGPLYLQNGLKQFEYSTEYYDRFKPSGVLNLTIHARRKCKTPYHREMV